MLLASSDKPLQDSSLASHNLHSSCLYKCYHILLDLLSELIKS